MHLLAHTTLLAPARDGASDQCAEQPEEHLTHLIHLLSETVGEELRGNTLQKVRKRQGAFLTLVGPAVEEE